MTGNRTEKRIREAARDGRLITVMRRKNWDVIDGSIVHVGSKWIVIANELNAGFNGHVLVRRSDIRAVEDAGHGAGFVRRALGLEGHWPMPTLEGVEVTTTQSILRSLAHRVPLVSIHYERADPDECRIGLPHYFRRRRFRLRLVTTAAEWDFSTQFRYRDVSRIGIGGAYQDRLAAVAGTAPAESRHYSDGRPAAPARTRTKRRCPQP